MKQRGGAAALARRAPDFTRVRVLIAAALLCAGSLAAPAAPVSSETAQSLLSAARLSLAGGDASGAQDILRRMRIGFPETPLLHDADGLSVECSLALKEIYRARYFLQRLLADAPGSRAAFTSTLAVAAQYYESREWLAALEYYSTAVDIFSAGRSGTRADLDLALVHAAEISAYQLNDAVRARSFFQKISGGMLPPAESALYRQLRVRLLWTILPSKTFGLKDENISSLRVDGDDLWVGTWNGGVARYSVSSAQSDAFPAPPYARSIEVADRRIWVGTTDGLAWYGKGTGRWGAEGNPSADHPFNVQVVRLAAGRLYAGTLGDGLLRQGDGWERVSDGSLPGRFVTCLAEDAARGRLLIGTMNIGLVILDLKTGEMTSLAELAAAFTSENITTILPARDGRIWIGTYGEGLWTWSPDGNSVKRYTRGGAEISDDWILSSCETDRCLYFGSFGGGVSVLSKGDGSWRRFGIHDGLSSMDVPAIAWRQPSVFFGTLGGGVSVYDEAADGAHP
jgi:ligand-binding sensor domain-containing protein